MSTEVDGNNDTNVVNDDDTNVFTGDDVPIVGSVVKEETSGAVVSKDRFKHAIS